MNSKRCARYFVCSSRTFREANLSILKTIRDLLLFPARETFHVTAFNTLGSRYLENSRRVIVRTITSPILLKFSHPSAR